MVDQIHWRFLLSAIIISFVVIAMARSGKPFCGGQHGANGYIWDGRSIDDANSVRQYEDVLAQWTVFYAPAQHLVPAYGPIPAYDTAQSFHEEWRWVQEDNDESCNW